MDKASGTRANRISTADRTNRGSPTANTTTTRAATSRTVVTRRRETVREARRVPGSVAGNPFGRVRDR